MNNTDISTNAPLFPANNFSGSIGGKKLASIHTYAPHQEKLEKLIGITLKKYFRNFNGQNINVIEIGTGAGLTSKIILDADQRIHLKSVDNEPKMVREAKKNLAEYVRCGRTEIIQKDALEYLKSVKRQSADCLASALTIHNFERKYREKIIREIFRILKPGGIFINADKYVPDNEKEYQKEYSWQMAQFEKAPDNDARNGWIEHYKIDNRPEIIMKEHESVELMKRIGFVDVVTSNRHHLEMLLTATKA